MDSLSDCMICNITFKADDSTVVVCDATYDGYLHVQEGHAPWDDSIRAVYCTECWNSLVAHSWKLHREIVQMKTGKEENDGHQ
jgi:hypothetical protein